MQLYSNCSKTHNFKYNCTTIKVKNLYFKSYYIAIMAEKSLLNIVILQIRSNVLIKAKGSL